MHQAGPAGPHRAIGRGTHSSVVLPLPCIAAGHSTLTNVQVGATPQTPASRLLRRWTLERHVKAIEEELATETQHRM